MNKRYIDFVPAKDSKKQVIKPAKKQVIKPANKVTKREEALVKKVEKTGVVTKVQHSAMPVLKSKHGVDFEKPKEEQRSVETISYSSRVVSSKNGPILGAIEEISMMATTNAPEKNTTQYTRSSGGNSFGDARLIKSQKVGIRKPFEQKKELVNSSAKTDDKSMYKTPKPPFINQNTVVKRPLSKNVYYKTAKPTTGEQPKGPVTIISKPEKDIHISVVITIILTIILGAAAGTIAFLLLPK